jgi:hypothetical protein
MAGGEADRFSRAATGVEDEEMEEELDPEPEPISPSGSLMMYEQ